MTIIDHDYEGDTYFPEIEPAEWNLVSCKTGHDDNFPHNFAYITLDRVKP
jgi:dihydrofolate reductase